MELDLNDLKELAELAGVINALKDSKEVEEILEAVKASAEKLRPLVEQASAFSTELDLKAFDAMTTHGLTTDQAVAVICSRHGSQGVLGSVAGKALSRK